MKSLHRFNTENEYARFVTSTSYTEPSCTWISDNEGKIVHYNRKQDPSKIDNPLKLEPLTITALETGNLDWYGAVIKYSINDAPWVETQEGVHNTIPVTSGDIIKFKGNNSRFYNYGNSNGTFRNSEIRFDVSGNILSLLNEDVYPYLDAVPNYRPYNQSYTYDNADLSLDGENTFFELFYSTNVVNAKDLILPTYPTRSCFQRMFIACQQLITAPSFDNVKMSSYCCKSMFASCTSLVTPPALPATTLKEGCYQEMFANCTNLATMPILPASTVPSNAYQKMFQSCTSLTTTTPMRISVDSYACKQMFSKCKNLVNASNVEIYNHENAIGTVFHNYACQSMFEYCEYLTQPPILSAPNIVGSCYDSMFYNCIELQTAPDLPAIKPMSSSYKKMFQGCKKLNYIKCLATDISSLNCLQYWTGSTNFQHGNTTSSDSNTTKGVANSGTFVKVSGVNYPTSTSGIPNNWTVQTYQE